MWYCPLLTKTLLTQAVLVSSFRELFTHVLSFLERFFLESSSIFQRRQDVSFCGVQV